MLTACTTVGSLDPILSASKTSLPYSISSVDIIDSRQDVVDIQNIDTPNAFFRGLGMASALNSKFTDELTAEVKTIIKLESNPSGEKVEALVKIKEARKTYYSYFWSEVEKVEAVVELHFLDSSRTLISKSLGNCMLSDPVSNASAESMNKKMESAIDCAVRNALYSVNDNSVNVQE